MLRNHFFDSMQMPNVTLHALGRLAGVALLYSLIAASFADGQATVRTPTVAITVHVTDSGNEAPIEQAKVELSRFPDGVVEMVFTDASGRSEFRRVNPGAYILRASKAGFSNSDVSVDVGHGESNRDVSIQMQPLRAGLTSTGSGTVSGRTLSIPKSASGEFQKGVRYLNEKKDAKGSIEHFQKAIALFPEYHEAYFLLGMAHLQLKSHGEAEAALTRAIQLNSKFIQPYYPLAVLLIAQKKYDEADRLLLQAMELDKGGWQWPFELARSKATQGQWDQALSYGRTAHDRVGAPSKVHLLLADLYSNTGNPGKAIEELEEFSKLDPSSPYMPRVQESLKELRKRM